MTDALSQPADLDWDQAVADNVRAELARERWSGRRAAATLGVNTMYVARRLSGETAMSPGDLKMFADLLHVPVSRFFLLPHLDSNQEPIGSRLAQVVSITERIRSTPKASREQAGVVTLMKRGQAFA